MIFGQPQIDRMDQGIGRIVAELKKTGKLAKTLILFLSDNGGRPEKINRGAPAGLSRFCSLSSSVF